jgi:hypothetical protein
MVVRYRNCIGVNKKLLMFVTFLKNRSLLNIIESIYGSDSTKIIRILESLSYNYFCQKGKFRDSVPVAVPVSLFQNRFGKIKI